MKTYFVSNQNVKISRSILKNQIAGLERVFDRFGIDKENNILIDDINIAAHKDRFLVNISHHISEKYYIENKTKFKNKYFEKNLGEDYISMLIKKELSVKISKILIDLYLANIVLKKNKLKEIYVYNENLDLEFLSFIKKYLNYKDNIKFTNLRFFKNNIKKFLFKIYNLVKLLFLLENLLFRSCLNFKKKEKIKFIASLRIDSDLSFRDYPYSPDSLVKKNNINFDDVLFYSEKKIQDLEKKYVEKFNVINSFNDFFKNLSFFDFIKNIYLKNFNLRIQMIKFFIEFNKFPNIIFNSFQTIIFWKIFYSIYEIKHNIILTVDCGVTSYYMHKNNSVETNFVYPHFTELGSVMYKNLPHSNDWSHLKFDNLYSDKTSKLYLDKLIKYKSFIETGFIFSDYILSHNKESIKKKINFVNDSKIVFFYDSSTGPRGIMSSKEYLLFLDSIDYVIQNTEFCICLLMKNYRLIDLNKDIRNKIYNLKKNSKFKLLNETTDAEKYTLLNIPDLIVTPPVSSILFEALSLKKKILVYNPLNRYTKLPNLLFNNKEIVKTTTRKELVKEIGNLLNKTDYKYIGDTHFISAEKGLRNLDKIFN